ncbi:hypothetical protein K488DRAFT_85667 [Vararia minispora EC-137]|uniref:Uncharacterized protein n=1 Tax=Vararia minispora EC-137 TaxID=1314806 RepID=A0ACB8QLP1_9AGAM|nr:hypothetical protein K488DRAFT_85667 [Vararia minispora EC-137]
MSTTALPPDRADSLAFAYIFHRERESVLLHDAAYADDDADADVPCSPGLDEKTLDLGAHCGDVVVRIAEPEHARLSPASSAFELASPSPSPCPTPYTTAASPFPSSAVFPSTPTSALPSSSPHPSALPRPPSPSGPRPRAGRAASFDIDPPPRPSPPRRRPAPMHGLPAHVTHHDRGSSAPASAPGDWLDPGWADRLGRGWGRASVPPRATAAAAPTTVSPASPSIVASTSSPPTVALPSPPPTTPLLPPPSIAILPSPPPTATFPSPLAPPPAPPKRGFRPITPPPSDPSDTDNASPTHIPHPPPQQPARRRGFGGFAPPPVDSSDEDSSGDEDEDSSGDEDEDGDGMEKRRDGTAGRTGGQSARRGGAKGWAAQLPTVRRPHRAHEDAFVRRHVLGVLDDAVRTSRSEGAGGSRSGNVSAARSGNGSAARSGAVSVPVHVPSSAVRPDGDAQAGGGMGAWEVDEVGAREVDGMGMQGLGEIAVDGGGGAWESGQDVVVGDRTPSPHPSDCSSCRSIHDYRLLAARSERAPLLDEDEGEEDEGGDEEGACGEDLPADPQGSQTRAFEAEESALVASPDEAPVVSRVPRGEASTVSRNRSSFASRDTSSATAPDETSLVSRHLSSTASSHSQSSTDSAAASQTSASVQHSDTSDMPGLSLDMPDLTLATFTQSRLPEDISAPMQTAPDSLERQDTDIPMAVPRRREDTWTYRRYRDSLGPPPGSPSTTFPAPTSALPVPASSSADLRHLSALDRTLLLLDVDPNPSDEQLPAYMLAPDVARGEATVDRGPRRPYRAPAPPPSYASLRIKPPKKKRKHGGVLRALFGGGAGASSLADGTNADASAQAPGVNAPSAMPTIREHASADDLRRPRALRRIFSHGSGLSADFAARPPSPASMPPMPDAVARLSTSPRSSMHDSAGDSVRSSVHGSVHGSVRSSVHESDSVHDSTRSSSPSTPLSSMYEDPTSAETEGASEEAACPFPSTTPIPGRPLLRDGRVLVYPEGFTCPACTPPSSSSPPLPIPTLTIFSSGENTGFAHGDPAHACTVCWAKFSRPFHSVLARFFRKGGASAREAARLQRPLGEGARFSAPPGLEMWDASGVAAAASTGMARVRTRA